jgi:hypothetical protein
MPRWKDEVMARKVGTASAVTTGALAGAMTLIRLVLVPFWRRGATSVESADLDRSVRWHDVRVALGLIAAWASAGTTHL